MSSKPIIGVNDLATTHPAIAAQLIEDKNTKTAQELSLGSHFVGWWLGDCGHEYKAEVASRTSGRGCAVCRGLQIMIGVNDLASLNPALASQWHPTKNGSITPEMVTVGSKKKVWWLGDCSHEWNASVDNRSHGQGCAVCRGLQIMVGANDLATLNPILASQWHPTANNELTPQMVTIGSHKKVWWLGDCSHEWQAIVKGRQNGNGCNICSGYQVLIGFNDLQTINPRLAGQWHPTKNEPLTPKMVTPSSEVKIWWLGPCGHTWLSRLSDRSRNRGDGCAVCSGKQLEFGYNDLKTTNSVLAEQWHPTKNGELTPEMVTGGMVQKAWWLGICGHTWTASINNRNKGAGCAICRGLQIEIGVNDLATLNPVLANEWHPHLNGELTPQMVTTGSEKKIWWICSCKNAWKSSVNRRSSGSGCPLCSTGKTERSLIEFFTKLSGFVFTATTLRRLPRRLRKSDRIQIDGVNETLKVIIEFDGEWTHGTNERYGFTAEQRLCEDADTTEVLLNAGYKVIRIREAPLDFITANPLYLNDPSLVDNLYQISMKNNGYAKSKRDDIEEIAKLVISDNQDWFIL